MRMTRKIIMVVLWSRGGGGLFYPLQKLHRLAVPRARSSYKRRIMALVEAHLMSGIAMSGITRIIPACPKGHTKIERLKNLS
jgi:hypothetical protein